MTATNAADEKESELVLVTGASGYIAGFLVQELLDRGFRVRGTVRSLKNAVTKYAHLHKLANSSNLELVEADLTVEKGWDEAVNGCRYVIHVACPIPDLTNLPKHDASSFMVPAVNGTQNVLNACLKHNIKRLVFTSSVSACINQREYEQKVVLDAGKWTDVASGLTSVFDDYAVAKTKSEQLVWRFVEDHDDAFECVAILPSAVIGPVLDPSRVTGSAWAVKGMLTGELPTLNIQQSFVDVRDVAKAHVEAMLRPKEVVHKQRYVVAHQSLWLKDMAWLLKEKYGDQYAISTSPFSDNLFKFLALFVPLMRSTVNGLGKQCFAINNPSIRDLGMLYRPVYETVCDAAESLIQQGVVKPVAPYRKYIGLGLKFVLYSGVIAAIGYKCRNQIRGASINT